MKGSKQENAVIRAVLLGVRSTALPLGWLPLSPIPVQVLNRFKDNTAKKNQTRNFDYVPKTEN